MNKLKCVEAIFDVLVGAGLSAEHASFDDAVMACVACATDPNAQLRGPLLWITDNDEYRSEIMVALDLIEWARASGCKEPVSDVLARAVEAGNRAHAE